MQVAHDRFPTSIYEADADLYIRNTHLVHQLNSADDKGDPSPSDSALPTKYGEVQAH